jgi:hypothetical protein
LGYVFIPKIIKKMDEQKEDRSSAVRPLPQDNIILCPKCGSNNIFISKRGFDASNACCGAILLGPLGLLCGQDGANRIEKNCLNCGKKF